MPSADWAAPMARRPVAANVSLPGSKSLTARYLILAAQASGTTRLRRPLRSRDTDLMAAGISELGVDVATREDDWLIEPAALRGPASIDCGLSGTVMRFLPALAALAEGPVHFDGDPHARTRPMAPALGALRSLGVTVEDDGRGALPFTIVGAGSVPGGAVTLDASASSQFISALLLAGPHYEQGITVRHDGPPVPSQPHLEMTVETLRDAGADVDDSVPNTWQVAPGPLNPLDITVEPDLSNAAAFVAAAVVTRGRVRVPDWPSHTTQAGDHIREVLDRMGAEVYLDRDGLTVTAPDGHHGVDLDLHDASELTPVVATLAATAASPSIIRGVAHIRHHETDRLHALATELASLGCGISQTDDGLRIDPQPLHGGRFGTYADHRMVMAGAVLGLTTAGVIIDDVGTVSKTMPDFTQRWDAMLDEPAARSGS